MRSLFRFVSHAGIVTLLALPVFVLADSIYTNQKIDTNISCSVFWTVGKGLQNGCWLKLFGEVPIGKTMVLDSTQTWVDSTAAAKFTTNVIWYLSLKDDAENKRLNVKYERKIFGIPVVTTFYLPAPPPADIAGESVNASVCFNGKFSSINVPVLTMLPILCDAIAIQSFPPTPISVMNQDSLKLLLYNAYIANKSVFIASNGTSWDTLPLFDTCSKLYDSHDSEFVQHFRLSIDARLKGTFSTDTINVYPGIDYLKYESSDSTGNPLYFGDSLKLSGQNVSICNNVFYNPCDPNPTSYTIPEHSKWLIFNSNDTVQGTVNPGFSDNSYPLYYYGFRTSVVDSNGQVKTVCPVLPQVNACVPIVNDTLVFSSQLKMALDDFMNLVQSHPTAVTVLQQKSTQEIPKIVTAGKSLLISAKNSLLSSVSVYNMKGELVSGAHALSAHEISMPLGNDVSHGFYVVKVCLTNGFVHTQSVVFKE